MATITDTLKAELDRKRKQVDALQTALEVLGERAPIIVPQKRKLSRAGLAAIRAGVKKRLAKAKS